MLDQIESKIQTMVETTIGQFFESQEFGSTLVINLIAALRKSTAQDRSGRVIAPDHYVVYVHPDWMAKNRSETQAGLAQLIRQIAREGSIHLAQEPSVILAGNPSLGRLESRVIASHEGSTVSQTREIRGSQGAVEASGQPPAEAYLITPEKDSCHLNLQVTSIGSDLSNHIVLKHPGVSPLHAQIRLINGKYVLFDAGSAEGTFVNGERITSTILRSGDVITLAEIRFIFNQEDAASGEITKPMQSNFHSMP